MELEGSALVFQVSAVNAGKKVPVGFLATMEPAAFLYTGLSFLLHMGLVAVFAFFMPSMRGDDSEDIDRDQILMMQKLLNAAAEREQEERQDETHGDRRRSEGRRHRARAPRAKRVRWGTRTPRTPGTSTASRARRTTRTRTSRSRLRCKRPRSSA